MKDKNLNEFLKSGNKILKILYIFLIIILIYLGTLILKELGILPFILTFLKILSPFFIGLIIAWLFEPAVSYFQKKNINRIIGTIIVYIIFLGSIFLMFNTIVPVIIKEVNEFIKTLPSILNDINLWFDKIFSNFGSNDIIDVEKIRTEVIGSIARFITELTANLPSNILNIIKSTFSFFGVFGLGLIIGFYLLFDFDNTKKVIEFIIPKKYKKEIKDLFSNINNSLMGFIKGTVLTSGLIFVLSALAFALTGLKAPLLFALICAITNIIPYVGPYIGAIPAIIVGFSQSTGTGIIVSVVILIIQTIEGEFIHPLVMSRTMKLHPVTILISLLVFEHFFGIVGMIVAAPVVAMLKIFYIYGFNKLKIFYKK